MASLFYTVYEGASQTGSGDPIAYGKIAIGAAAVNSSPIPHASRVNQRMIVRMFADADCFVAWGASGITVLNDGSLGEPFGAENPEYKDVQAGDEISVIERV